jgi:hypothetical protein
MAQYRKDLNQFLPQEKTLFETVMIADRYGNVIGGANPSGTAVDAFGRARMSTPLTMFDSSHRYRDNGLWVTSNTSGNSTVTFSANEGLINMAVTTAANAEVIRETTKVFSYQPGKSLQILNTFVMAPAQTNLRQRVGYYGANNGIYLELANNTLYLVERSYVTGNVTETRVAQSNWNIDTMDGTNTGAWTENPPTANRNPSGRTLDISKAQISYIDVEWLGLGSVRCGFIIDGQLIPCHTFHHANYITSTYITTASLPLRYEIKNIGVTANSSTLKQVCSSIVSEGGYELRGSQQAVGTPVEGPKDLGTTLGADIPIVSIRLKSDRLDAIVIVTALSLLCVGNNARVKWKVIKNGTLANTTWTSASADSSVEYDLTANTITGGTTLASGFATATTQASISTDILKEALFKFQLERNGLTGTAFPITVTMATAFASDDGLATIDWEEISR